MKFCAIICEFNPFHNGHKFLIEQAKAKTGLPVLCLMSGNFCQRASACCEEKHIRAKHAIEAGADVVFELPTVFATGSANTFARGAIGILNRLPVSHLVFGSECGNLNKLIMAKDFCKSLDENKDIKTSLKSGKNYKSVVYETAEKESKEISDILKKPNNALAIEYLKALEGTKIIPITIKREDNYFGGGNEFSSSTSIRKFVENNEFEKASKFVPSFVLEDLKSTKNSAVIDEHLFFSLKTATKDKLSKLFSVSEGLENRVFKLALECKDLNEFVEKCVTKRYSRIRLRRVVLENFFGITKETIDSCFNTVPTIILLAKSPDINFDGFFEKNINLVLKKSDRKKFAAERMFEIDSLAEKLFER